MPETWSTTEGLVLQWTSGLERKWAIKNHCVYHENGCTREMGREVTTETRRLIPSTGPHFMVKAAWRFYSPFSRPQAILRVIKAKSEGSQPRLILREGALGPPSHSTSFHWSRNHYCSRKNKTEKLLGGEKIEKCLGRVLRNCPTLLAKTWGDSNRSQGSTHFSPRALWEGFWGTIDGQRTQSTIPSQEKLPGFITNMSGLETVLAASVSKIHNRSNLRN